MKISRAILHLSILCIPAWLQAGTAALDTAITDSVKTNEESRESQQTIDKLADDTIDMLQEYRNTLQQIDSLKTYNTQLEKLINNQNESRATIRKQLNNIDQTQRNIIPLTLNMVNVLGEFVRLDMPFHVDERNIRLKTIREMMDRPDVSLPDKYRRIMEAYQIEMEYGRTIDTYSDNIVKDGKNYAVNILRIGRVALLYQTLDERECGYWDKVQKVWKGLPDNYNASIAEGILIADKQSPPDFINVPVSAPEHKQ
jgi:hypothetical protein